VQVIADSPADRRSAPRIVLKLTIDDAIALAGLIRAATDRHNAAQDKSMGTADVARELNVTTSTIRSWLARGLPRENPFPRPRKILGRSRWRMSEIDTWRAAGGIGGEFAVSLATHHGFAGDALAEIQGSEREAAEELERAVSLYDAGPGPGEEYWFGGKALAGIDLATVRLRSGALDAAVSALDPVLSLPPAQRITAMTRRLPSVRAELAAPIFRGSAQARALDERIEEFGRETITASLHSLPGQD
jgi:predicted DNA-binding transcriptional regulator AlpA